MRDLKLITENMYPTVSVRQEMVTQRPVVNPWPQIFMLA